MVCGCSFGAPFMRQSSARLLTARCLACVNAIRQNARLIPRSSRYMMKDAQNSNAVMGLNTF